MRRLLLQRVSTAAARGGGVARRPDGLHVVLFADDVSVDEPETIPSDEAVVAGGAGETVDMVDAVVDPQHHLIRRDRLTTSGTRSGQPKQPTW